RPARLCDRDQCRAHLGAATESWLRRAEGSGRVNRLVVFGRFWYDFIIGDDWRLALGVVVAITVVFIAAHHGADWWWLLPLAVAALLTVSVTHAARHRSP